MFLCSLLFNSQPTQRFGIRSLPALGFINPYMKPGRAIQQCLSCHLLLCSSWKDMEPFSETAGFWRNMSLPPKELQKECTFTVFITFPTPFRMKTNRNTTYEASCNKLSSPLLSGRRGSERLWNIGNPNVEKHWGPTVRTFPKLVLQRCSSEKKSFYRQRCLYNTT